jgi:hypothetical protein
LFKTLPFANNFIIEIRTVRADDIWLSNSYGRASAQFTLGRFLGSQEELRALYGGAEVGPAAT